MSVLIKLKHNRMVCRPDNMMSYFQLNILPCPFKHQVVLLLLFLALVLAALSGCTTAHKPELILSDHPLIDKIWDVKNRQFISRAEFQRRILSSEYLLLGERHDNPIHHEYQAWVIRQLQHANKHASVAFEMIDERQGQLLAKHRIASADEMITLLNRVKTHWYYEQRYKGVFEAVIKAGFPIVPANLNRQRLKQLTAKGEKGLPKAYRKMLSQVPLSKSHTLSLQKEIKSSHCNMLGDKMVAKLMLSQRLRDAVMAHSLSKIRSPVKVFVAGAGHVRRDRGVPLYLEQLNHNAKQLALGFTEVGAGLYNPGDYARRWGSKALPFHYLWFTPQVHRKDLCADFQQHLKQKAPQKTR